MDEFLELTSISLQPLPLFDPAYPANTWHLEGGVSFRFPPNVVLAPSAILLVVGFDPEAEPAALAAFRSRHGVSTGVTIFGPYTGRLGNKSDRIELYKPDPPQLPPHPDAGYVPAILVEKVNYDLNEGWPAGTSGTGLSLQRRTPRAYGNDPVNWFAAGPTPGAPAPAEIPPAVVEQPASLVVVRPGDDAAFSVAASGTPPLTYQWRWEGVALSGCTNSILVLREVQAHQAGSYDVVVANGAGVATSAPARLSVILPPQLLGVRWRADAGAEVSLGSGTGPALELLASTDLVDWILIARFTNYANPGLATDPAASQTPMRFYRSRVVSQ